ncbi:MAG: GNAT family N-acetyltransferase [Flavobacteriales bacterium]
MRIRYIKASDTHDLRHRVLRPYQPIEEVDFPNDRNPDSFHLGAFIGGHLIGVASFYLERNENLKGWKQYRLRGMAAHPELQGQGVGRRLLEFGIEHVRTLRGDLLWCNAREKARTFYERQGFRTHGDAFALGDVGPHYLMSRPL